MLILYRSQLLICLPKTASTQHYWFQTLQSVQALDTCVPWGTASENENMREQICVDFDTLLHGLLTASTTELRVSNVLKIKTDLVSATMLQ